MLRYVDETVIPFIGPETYLPFSLPGIGLLVMLGLLVLIGWLAAGLVGRTVMRTGERLLDRTPIVRGIYGTLKQLFATVLSQSSRTFREVVLVEYPAAASGRSASSRASLRAISRAATTASW